jgi:hypothetical protein
MLQLTASGQKLFGMPLIVKRLRTIFIIVRFFFLHTPFCWGVKAAVSYLLIPWFSQKFANSCELYSPPLSYAKNFYWVGNLFLNKRFIAFKSYKGFRFFSQKINPYFTTIIINEGNYISLTSIRMWCYWPANVGMNKLQCLLHSPRFSLWELIAVLFANNTFFTDLRRSCNLRKTRHHVLLL